MRALISERTGGPESLRVAEMPVPSPGPDQVLIEVKACAINYPDLLMIQDKYQLKPPRPFAVGSELAGVVRATGKDVSRWRAGDRVAGFTGHGGLAEFAAVPADRLHVLPPERDFASGATLLYNYGTAYYALKHRGKVRQGSRVLILGASGLVGGAAIQIAKALGATVVAAVSGEVKAAAARAVGADHTLVYGLDVRSKDSIRALTESFKRASDGHGFDAVLDPIGGDYAEAALRALAWSGRYLVVGFVAGIPRIPLNLTLLKGCDICGVFWGEYADREPVQCAEDVATLFRLWNEGRISPQVTHLYRLESAVEAFQRLESRDNRGKAVVVMGE